MKAKKIVLFFITIILSFSMMACPSIENSPPEIVKLVDGEIIYVNNVIYEHPKGSDFHPDDMIQNLIDNQNIVAIDYDQSKMIFGQDRKFNDISDQIVVTSFYEIWMDGEDANFDGVIDEVDEEYYGYTKTDVDGVKSYDQNKISFIEILSVGSEIDFTLFVSDDEGDTTELSGTIVIVTSAD